MKNAQTLRFVTNGNATISIKGNSNNVSLEYSYNNADWSEWDLSALTINQDDTLYVRGNNPDGLSHDNEDTDEFYAFIIEGDKVSCSGNIMSLIDYKNLPDVIPCDYCFYKLFSECTALTTAPELPAKALTASCYESMFSGCSSLTSAPELPATELADSCYCRMFSCCSSLIIAPKLPATKLADWCYSGMFFGCTSLKTAPELPAKRLVDFCYRSMFSECTALIAKPELPATELTNGCYYRMFKGCTLLKDEQ